MERMKIEEKLPWPIWTHQRCFKWYHLWSPTASSSLRLSSHCFGILRQLCSIRRSLSSSVFHSLVASWVLSRLDYGNVTLAGITSLQLRRLQSVINAAARLVFSASCSDHVIPLLRQLHSIDRLGVCNPHPKLHSLLSQERVKLQTSNLAGRFRRSIQTKAH